MCECPTCFEINEMLNPSEITDLVNNPQLLLKALGQKLMEAFTIRLRCLQLPGLTMIIHCTTQSDLTGNAQLCL